MSDNQFGDYIRRRREDAHLTRAELAKQANVSVSLIEKIELGTRPTTLPTLQVLFDQLDVPSMYRKHILAVSLPNVFGTAPSSAASTPTDDDLADLNSLPHPASFYVLPTFKIVAANAAHERAFPGSAAGTNFVEWMFLNPAARTVIVGWRKEAQRLLHSLRMLTPNITTNAEVTAAVRNCQDAPEWKELWHSTPPRQPSEDVHILIRTPGSHRTEELTVRIYSPEFPHRPWWLCRLIPRSVR
ncbi:helix-turn-helix domain-containing protein [Nocardia crassostreae]|uniref:helix-turn-helix domain-containing protein n=1 Tax=Nocardia crassostreae TaxID=53428 RepID=UPI00082F5057|nr:helix-turn-helix domain-containing protein [Nocardia crassostreae]